MYTLESNKRLSQSILWQLQDSAYSAFGSKAWGELGVPFYLTSNPFLAKRFVNIILAYLRDCISEMDFSYPFYIFDIGAGSGRLGFLILKHLLESVSSVISPKLKICYVMTDMVEKNLKFCKNHPLLKPFIQSGNLDFALYKHDQESPLHLLEAKMELKTGGICNPCVLICTYYFDTVPQDLFRCKKGQLEEGQISLFLPREEKIKPEIIMNLKASYAYIPLKDSENYYPKYPAFHKLLQQYCDQFDNCPFLFPIGGLKSLHYFSLLSNQRYLLLAGDQGVATEAQVKSSGEPKIFKHASFSMAVNYHLIGKFFENENGIGLLTRFPDPKFAVMCGILGKGSFSNTRFAFFQELDAFGPVEYWKLTDITLQQLETFSLEKILLYIKLGNWDPVNFHAFFPVILKKLPLCSKEEYQFLYETIDYVFDQFYPIASQEGQFVMNLGVLLLEMNQLEEAMAFFQKALKMSPDDPAILRNLAKCHQKIGNLQVAKKLFQKAGILEVDPKH